MIGINERLSGHICYMDQKFLMDLMQWLKRGKDNIQIISFELIILHETLTNTNRLKSALNYLHTFQDNGNGMFKRNS